MEFELIRAVTKPIHIILGCIVLAIGLMQLMMRKAGKPHRNLGKAYVVAMIASVSLSLPSSLYLGQIFLTVIACFSLFLAFTGYRFAVIRSEGQIHIIDKIAAVLFLAMAFGMAIYALLIWLKGAVAAGIILSVFSFIFLSGTLTDARYLLFARNPAIYYSGNKWLRSHIGRIVGSYIAAVTAFLVNIEPFGSSLLNWLLPTVAGTAMMFRFIRKYAPGKESVTS